MVSCGQIRKNNLIVGSLHGELRGMDEISNLCKCEDLLNLCPLLRLQNRMSLVLAGLMS